MKINRKRVNITTLTRHTIRQNTTMKKAGFNMKIQSHSCPNATLESFLNKNTQSSIKMSTKCKTSVLLEIVPDYK